MTRKKWLVVILCFATVAFLPAKKTAAAEPDQRMPLPEGVASWLETAKVAAPPAELGLDPFYQKHVAAMGLPVIASDRVRDEALIEAGLLIGLMLQDRPDVAQAMVESGTRFVVVGHNEFTTDIPEYRTLEPKNYWDRRARGLGATPERPAVSCGEENLLALPGDPYAAENILIHEFAHAIHEMGLRRIDERFDSRLQATYEAAMAAGLWRGKYAATNPAEYWAEAVQSYFGTNRENDHDHNHVNTRDELKEYDQRLFELVDEVFRGAPWNYVHPTARTNQRHLAALDREHLPAFAWPERLVEETRKLDALKREKLRAAEGEKPAGDGQ